MLPSLENDKTGPLSFGKKIKDDIQDGQVAGSLKASENISSAVPLLVTGNASHLQLAIPSSLARRLSELPITRTDSDTDSLGGPGSHTPLPTPRPLQRRAVACGGH